MRVTCLRILSHFIALSACTTVLVASGCGSGNSTPRGRLAGVVYDGAPSPGSRVAAGVKVIVLRYEFESSGARVTKFGETTSDREGRFTFSLLPDYYGTYADNGYKLSGDTSTFCSAYVSTNVYADQTSNIELGYDRCSPDLGDVVIE